MNYAQTIQDTQSLLKINSEWIKRYESYASLLLANRNYIASNRKLFREFSPLRFYLSTTNAKNANKKLSLDVRYRGQSVATLDAFNSVISVSTTNQDKNNSRDFDCAIALNNIPWRDPLCNNFRKFFKNRISSRNSIGNKQNEEHNVENLLLTEFSKRTANNKRIIGIQPIKICGNRFGMPTPLRASNHQFLTYAKQYGGGIDIFARTGKGKATYLTVIEVKDENKLLEPPEAALQQAIQYAVFIRELLRSASGQNWYAIFGFKGALPKKLVIRAACAMPDNFPDISFAHQRLPIDNDIIECHYIYFKYDGLQLSNFQTSL